MGDVPDVALRVAEAKAATETRPVRLGVEIDDVVEATEALVRIHDRLDVLDHDTEAEPTKAFAYRSAITVEHHLGEQCEHDPVGALEDHVLGHAGRCLGPAELAVERRHSLKVATGERHRADPARNSHGLSLILAANTAIVRARRPGLGAVQQQPTVPELAELLEDSPPLDRTTVNSWEDTEFVQAVHATGRRKLIFCALWTEVCMAFTALDALREGYEVYPVVDAIGGTSPEAHRAGLERCVQAGAQPISWVSLACELQRDWARLETVPAIVEIVLTDRLLQE